MSDLARITPERAAADFAKAGFKPAIAITLDRKHGCCCPIAAAALAGGWTPAVPPSLQPYTGMALTLGMFAGFSPDYIRGFVVGFDSGIPLGHIDLDIERIGRYDGIDVRRSLSVVHWDDNAEAYLPVPAIA